MELDELDIKVLKENFDEETINAINYENCYQIIKYLKENNIYYYKDLFLTSLDLFLLEKEIFIEKFEKLKKKLGEDYADMLGEDCSLIEIMYE